MKGEIIMEFLLALQFLTRIPINITGHIDDKLLARSMAYFPLVGFIIGLVTAILHIMVSNISNVLVADLIAIAFMILITGNMHLDGLMDTADGIYSCRPREGILEIMKDSRVGAHGVAAGGLAILAKFVFLSQIGVNLKFIAILIVPTIGRWTQVYGAAKYTYARKSGGKANFTELVGKREFLLGSATTGVLLYFLFGINKGLLGGGIQGSILMVASLVGAKFIGSYLAKKIDGVTGDTLGAMTECIEIWILFILVCIS
jgi:adenosylcobinamide-GDP ribazoletransferase